jgi:hypothetical protein
MFCHVFLRRYVSGQYHESYLHGFTRSRPQLSHWLDTVAFETEYDKPFVAALFLGGILREIGIELKYMGLMWTQIHQPSTSLPDICAFVIHPSYIYRRFMILSGFTRWFCLKIKFPKNHNLSSIFPMRLPFCGYAHFQRHPNINSY